MLLGQCYFVGVQFATSRLSLHAFMLAGPGGVMHQFFTLELRTLAWQRILPIHHLSALGPFDDNIEVVISCSLLHIVFFELRWPLARQGLRGLQPKID